MQIVNNGLPDIIYKWLQVDFYDHEEVGDAYSVTTLLKPIKEIILTRRHKDSISIDAEDRMWSLFGSGIHAVLEKLDLGVNVSQEERLFVTFNDFKLTGKYDVLIDNQLMDFKVTSAYTLMYNSRFDEWRHQLSILRWLYYQKHNKLLSSVGKIVAILRDWTQRDTKRANYPQRPILEISIDLLSIEEVSSFLEGRIKLIKHYENSLDNDLPSCSEEERWFNEKKQTYAKCERYCVARSFCNQAKQVKEENV